MKTFRQVHTADSYTNIIANHIEATEEKAEDIKPEKDIPLEPKKANRTKSRPKKPAPKD